MPLLSRRNFVAGGLASLAVVRWGRVRAAEASVLPDYWRAPLDAVAGRIAALRSAGAGEASFFFTDVHDAANSLRSGPLIAELVKLTGCRRAFFGGDIPCAYGNANYKATLDLALETYLRNWADPILGADGQLVTAKGNHDFTIRESASSSAGYTYSDAYAREFIVASHRRPFTVTNPADPLACYCYRDVPAERLRWIVADSQDSASVNPNQYWGVGYGMHQAQLEWMADVALGTLPAGWSAIVMHHIPCAPIVESGGVISSLVTFRQVLEAYQNRGKVTLFGRERDFADARGRILVDLTGHHHADRWTFYNGIHHLTVSCDAYYNDMRGDSPFCGGVQFVRTRNSVHEHVVDAIQYSPSADALFATRLGEGMDRAFHVTPVTVARGDSRQFESTLLSGPVTWAAYDGDGASYDSGASGVDNRWKFFNAHGTVGSDGTFRAGTPGSSVVFAMDAAFNKEIFGVTVT